MPRDSTILRLDERDDYRLHHCWARRRLQAKCQMRLDCGGDCRLSKYFSLKLWREERAIKGAWNKDSDHSNFWRFLICDYRLHEYAIWMLLKRILFVIVLVFVPATGRITRSKFPGTDPVIAIIILQFIDVMLICMLRPSSSRSMDWMNALAGFLLLGAYVCISVPVFMPDEDARPWYINEFVLVIVSLLPTAVVTVYCLACLFDKLFDFSLGWLESQSSERDFQVLQTNHS